jgi:hypothetical protein
MNPDYDPSKRHHARDGFRNSTATPPRTRAEFFRWQRERRALVVPPPPTDLSVVAPASSLRFVTARA